MKKEDAVVENLFMFRFFKNENNFFKIMDLNICFNIDLNLLESSYIEKIAIEKDNFKNIFKLNQSYYTLKDSLLRAKYLLEILGIKKKEEYISNNLNILNEIIYNKEKLQEIEKIVDLKILKKISLNRIRYLKRFISILFNLIGFLRNKNFSNILLVIHELNYYNTYLIEINEKILKEKENCVIKYF